MPVELDSLPLPETLRHEAARWLERYYDTKLHWETTSDDAWLAEGRRLFLALRAALGTTLGACIPRHLLDLCWRA